MWPPGVRDVVVVVVGGAVGPVYGVSGLPSGSEGQWSLPHSQEVVPQLLRSFLKVLPP